MIFALNTAVWHLRTMKAIKRSWLRLNSYLSVHVLFLLYIFFILFWDVSREMKWEYKQILNFHTRTLFEVLFFTMGIKSYGMPQKPSIYKILRKIIGRLCNRILHCGRRHLHTHRTSFAGLPMELEWCQIHHLWKKVLPAFMPWPP